MTDDPYLIPGTQTLRNLAGITDPEEFARFEFDVTIARITQLESSEVSIPGRWDLVHLQGFHRHIFQDVYDWAGKLRTIDISKGSTLFALARFVQPAAAELFNDLARQDCLQNLDRGRFVVEAAHVLSEVNALHPFREGNGRANRAFVGQLAERAGYRVEWQGLDRDQNVAASVASMRGDETPMRVMLDALTSRLPL